jgi:hypothetical protein
MGSKLVKHICLPFLLFVVFIAAGSIALIFEHWHNDLLIGAGTFITALVSITSLGLKAYNDIF